MIESRYYERQVDSHTKIFAARDLFDVDSHTKVVGVVCDLFDAGNCDVEHVN